MNTSRLRITSFRRSASLALLAVMATSVLGVANVAAVATDSSTPMVLQNISLADVVANKGGICNGGFNMVMKTASGPNNAINYLNAAQRCGLKVIMSFPDVVNYTTGRVYPSKVPYWVNLVKNHPDLYGYLTVKEPSWNHISGAEIRSLYSAFHKADPTHPVVAIFGDTPHFNQSVNPWTAGMANILMVDWYPVETASNGCSRTRNALRDDRAEELRQRPERGQQQDARDAHLVDGADPQEPWPGLPQEAGSDRGAPPSTGP